MGGQALAIPEILGAIEDTCAVSERLGRIARQLPPAEPPYALLARRSGRPGVTPALNALGELGQTLNDVAELMPEGASISAVSRWLRGERPYPAELPDVLEQLVGLEAGRILALIPRT